jgi:EAL and modified HD-GYP domain-containing signal transduction protein
MSARLDTKRIASMARRPVFNSSLEVVAYEIVLGAGPIRSIASSDAGGGSKLLVNSVLEADVAALSDAKPVHLTVLPSAIEAGLPPELIPEGTILVICSNAEPTPATFAAVEEVRNRGFRIVLDDLTANPRLHPLLRLAYGVKVNIGSSVGPSPSRQMSALKTAGIELIADGVKSYDDLRCAKTLGFTQFQGSFLSKPDGLGDEQASAAQLGSLELVTLLQNPDADISDIAAVIRRDVNLSYRILKVVNSARYSLSRPLESIEEAVVLVGTRQIVSWVGMMGMSGVNNKPDELTRTAMVRARVCETLAGRLGRSDARRFYLVGLFSVIEALLDIPAEQALRRLPLAPEIIDAITAGRGVMGEVMRAVIAHEGGDWARAQVSGLEDWAMSDAFQTAMVEVDRTWAKIAP